MTYEELQDVLWDFSKALAGKLVSKPADEYIRWKYPEGGQPDWRWKDTVLFLYLEELADAYGQQVHKTSHMDGDRVILDRYRTRVWEITFTAYGPNSYEAVTAIKDGVFNLSAKKQLAEKDLFLVPDMPPIRQAPELFNGMWWPRCDFMLHFNELYRMPPEDAGAIERVSIEAGGSR